MFKTQNEYKTTSADIAFFFFLMVFVVLGINFLAKDFYIFIAKLLITMDLYLAHFIYMFLNLFNIQISLLNEFEKFYSYMLEGFFDKINYNLQFKDGIKFTIYNYYEGSSYKTFTKVFDYFYYFNILFLLSILYGIQKLIQSKKIVYGTTIYHKQLKAYYDKVIEHPVRKGLNKQIITNDHQYAAESNNPEYIEGSIKLTLLNNDRKFNEDINKIKNKINEIEKAKNNIIKLKKISSNTKIDEKTKMQYTKTIKESEEIIIKNKLSNIEEEKYSNFLLIEKYRNVKIQFNKQDLKVLIELVKEKEKNSKNMGIEPSLNSAEKRIKKYMIIKQKLEKFNNWKKQNKNTKEISPFQLTEEEITYLKDVENEYSRNIEKFNKEYDEGVIQTPSYYILHPKEGKVPRKSSPESKEIEYETPGIHIILELIYKYVIDEYEPAIKKQINELENINKGLNQKNPNDILSYELNLQIISDLERQLDNMDKKSRLQKISELSLKHKYQETYVLALWEFGNTIMNMPTGPLVKLKFINPVLWFAFTSLKRPSLFKTGAPIYIMFLYEQEGVISENKEENYIKEDSFNEYMKETGSVNILKEKNII